MSSFNKFAKPSMQMKMLVILLVSCYRHDGVSICHLAYFYLVLQHCLALIVLQNCYNMCLISKDCCKMETGQSFFTHTWWNKQQTQSIFSIAEGEEVTMISDHFTLVG
jgi:hypothetical protein